MYIILWSVQVATSLFSMVTAYRQESLFLVADQTTIHSCSNGSFLGRWGVNNIRLLWYFEICRVICEISHQPIIDGSESCRPYGLIRINSWFDHTLHVWANTAWDLYVTSGARYSLFNILQNYWVADHYIFGSNRSVVKLDVLSFAAIVKPLHAQWVYGRALLLAPGDMNLVIDNCLQISSYPFELSPIAIVSQMEHITLMT